MAPTPLDKIDPVAAWQPWEPDAKQPWNLQWAGHLARRAGFGANDGCESDGQNIPFATTKAERIAVGDSRRSLEERYKDHEGYVKAVTKAAQKLGKDRFLLPADVEVFIDEAEQSDVLRDGDSGERR